MESLDILYLSLSVGFLVLVGYLSYTLYQVGKSLREIRPVLEDIRDIADDVRGAKDSLKSGLASIATFVSSFVDMKTKREEVKKNDKK